MFGTLDESTLRDSNVEQTTYTIYVDKGYLAEEILFCKSLESTNSSKHIYNKLKTNLEANNISMKNVTSCAADSALLRWERKIDERSESKYASCLLCHLQGKLSS
ncbi:SCAN domain-containing protein 3 [Trichonephila clavata]|uniref:SCAN domain-containing protein 3 n=1 Tax=Trichonephila clavata TaxID=2740835 RepID=A0A8X6GLR7_TRICU|nr:SCAN domain-containing protein 3 [Trichonephila clavata]